MEAATKQILVSTFHASESIIWLSITNWTCRPRDFSTILFAQFDWLKVIWTTRQLDGSAVQVERVSFTFTSLLHFSTDF